MIWWYTLCSILCNLFATWPSHGQIPGSRGCPFHVGGFSPPLWKMMEFVKWDHDIPNFFGKKNKNPVPKFQSTNQLWWVIDTSDSWLTMLSLSWMIDETHSIRSFSSFSPWLSFKRGPSPWHFTPITPLKSASGLALPRFPNNMPSVWRALGRRCRNTLAPNRTFSTTQWNWRNTLMAGYFTATRLSSVANFQGASWSGEGCVHMVPHICYASYIHIKVHITFIFICYTYK